MQQCPRNIDFAPLTAGELPQRTLHQIFKIQQLRQLCQPFPEILSTDAVERRPALKILPYGQILIQRGILENDSQTPLDGIRLLVKRFSVNPDTAGILGQLAAEDVDGGGFSGAVNPQKREQLPFFHPEAQILHRLNLSEALAQVVNFNDTVHGMLPFSKAFWE